jgi:AraC-like DNA-binding protein
MTQYSTHPVHTSLQQYIQMYLIVKVDETAPLNEVFTAKPIAALGFNFGLNQAHIIGLLTTKNEKEVIQVSKYQSCVYGMHNQPISGTFPPNTNILYSVFTPTGIHHFLQGNASRVLNTCFSFEALGMADKFSGLSEKLEKTDGSLAVIELIEGYLLNYFSNENIVFSVKNMSPVTDFILRQNGVVQVNQLAEKFKISRRWLEKTFVEQVGLSPKEFARIVRFKAMLSHVTIDPLVSWGFLRENYDYYDQSHLVRDFRDFTGQSPTEFFKDSVPFLNEIFHKTL